MAATEPAKIRNIPVEISRTGYTGDLGFEIWMQRANALAVWDALVDAGRAYGIMPAGMLALTSAAICPVAGPPPPSCPMRPGRPSYHCASVTYHRFPGQTRAQQGPLDHPPRSPRGQGPCDRNPSMQPNTVNAHHDTRPPVPPELLEAVARALAAALIPPPRRPPPSETETADFLTAAQLARRLGVSRETVRTSSFGRKLVTPRGRIATRRSCWKN